MNRIEFMNELEYLLQDIPEEEKQEALQYYNDYFDEAGNEKEAVLIEELESPEKVAAIIKDGLGESDGQDGEYSETGYEDERFSTKQEIDRRTYLEESNYNYQNFREKRRAEQAQQGYDSQRQYQGYQHTSHNGNSALKIILIVLLCIFAIPIGGLLIGLGAGLLGLIVGIGGAVIGLIVGGLAMIGSGIGLLFSIPSAGLAISGLGLILTAIGLALLVLLVWLASTAAPAVVRGIVNVFRSLFTQKEGQRR